MNFSQLLFFVVFLLLLNACSPVDSVRVFDAEQAKNLVQACCAKQNT